MPRRRRPGLAALAVLLVLGGALTTTQLVLQADQRISVIRITQQLGTGQGFAPAAMQEALIADPGVEYVRCPASSRPVTAYKSPTLTAPDRPGSSPEAH